MYAFEIKEVHFRLNRLMNEECRSNGKLDNFDNLVNIDSKLPNMSKLNEVALVNVRTCCINDELSGGCKT
ncbi:MAG: hypothetical protein ACTS4T_01475 [Candidatus Hodgkinia cicadicola]